MHCDLKLLSIIILLGNITKLNVWCCKGVGNIVTYFMISYILIY